MAFPSFLCPEPYLSCSGLYSEFSAAVAKQFLSNVHAANIINAAAILIVDRGREPFIFLLLLLYLLPREDMSYLILDEHSCSVVMAIAEALVL